MASHKANVAEIRNKRPSVAVAPWWEKVVVVSCNTLKQWRSLATRYDNLALTYLSAIVLHAVVIWSTL